MIKADKKPNSTGNDLRSISCQWEGCKEMGTFRAPVSKQNLKRFHWFCLEHIRIYNSKWNYCEGMSERDFEESVRSDLTWNRPTWPFVSDPEYGSFDIKNTLKFENFVDPFDIFGINKQTYCNHHNKISDSEKKAISLLGLEFPVSKDEVKARYKFLVKSHHPDRHGGDKKAEEKLKKIIEAYEIIMNMCV